MESRRQLAELELTLGLSLPSSCYCYQRAQLSVTILFNVYNEWSVNSDLLPFIFRIYNKYITPCVNMVFLY